MLHGLGMHVGKKGHINLARALKLRYRLHASSSFLFAGLSEWHQSSVTWVHHCPYIQARRHISSTSNHAARHVHHRDFTWLVFLKTISHPSPWAVGFRAISQLTVCVCCVNLCILFTYCLRIACNNNNNNKSRDVNSVGLLQTATVLPAMTVQSSLSWKRWTYQYTCLLCPQSSHLSEKGRSAKGKQYRITKVIKT